MILNIHVLDLLLLVGFFFIAMIRILMLFHCFEFFLDQVGFVLFCPNMRVGICLLSLFFRTVMWGRVFVSLHFQIVDLASLRRVLSILYVGSLDLPYILSLTV